MKLRYRCRQQQEFSMGSGQYQPGLMIQHFALGRRCQLKTAPRSQAPQVHASYDMFN